MAILGKTAEHVVRDVLFVPDLLRMETIRAMVEAAVARRVSDGSVDGLLLPTINMLAAAWIPAPPEAAASMAAWIKKNAAAAPADHLAQARWAARAADRLDLLELIPQSLPDSSIHCSAGFTREMDPAAFPRSGFGREPPGAC